MKTKLVNVGICLVIALALILTIPFACKAQKSDCYRPYSFVGTAYIGFDKVDMVKGLEFGAWGVDKVVGGYVGFTMYSKLIKTEDVNKIPYTYKEMMLDIYIRGSVKIVSLQTVGIYQLLTAYASVDGMLGASWRIYRKVNDVTLIGLEPTYSNRNHLGVNLIFTFALNN